MTMTHPKDITTVLEELYAIDEGLRAHEKQLTHIVQEMLSARPDTKFDKAFARELRAQILSKDAVPADADRLSLSKLFDAMRLKRLLLPGGALAVLALILVVVSVSGPTTHKLSMDSTSSKPMLIALGDGAFGTLNGELPETSPAMTTGDMAVAPRPESGGGANAPTVGFGGGGPGLPTGVIESAVSSTMIAPEDYVPTYYTFVYGRGLLTAPEAQMPVYRAQDDALDLATLSGALSGVRTGSMDLSGFSNLKVQSLSVHEDTDKGYIIYMNADDASISINQDYNSWPHPERDCVDEACYRRYMPSPEDVPTDEKIIAIAETFLLEKGISLEGYGPGQVTDQWRAQYTASSHKAEFYVPNVMSVVFPTIIDGKTIYSAGGSAYGLFVGVDIRTEEVSSVSNIKAQRFESSNYAMETDTVRLLDIARRNGRTWDIPEDENAKIIEVSLGTPEIVLMQTYVSSKDGRGQQLFIPAYSFPIEGTSDGSQYWTERVLVPLAKEVLDSQYDGSTRPMPVPFMRGEPGVVIEEPVMMEAPSIEPDGMEAL